MKKIVFIIVAIVVIATALIFIKESIDKTNSLPITKDTENSKDVNSPADEESIPDFSIKIKDKYISLKERYNNLSDVLGTPISEEIEVLGSGSDTFSGSRIKTSTYDGLVIEEFSPEKEGNDNFWILSMTITKENYSTEKDLTIGDNLEKLKEIYEGIEILKDGRTDPNNCAYIMGNNTDNNFIVFQVKDGSINEIKIYHELQ